MFINIAQFLTQKKMQGAKIPTGTGADGARKLQQNTGDDLQGKKNCAC